MIAARPSAYPLEGLKGQSFRKRSHGPDGDASSSRRNRRDIANICDIVDSFQNEFEACARRTSACGIGVARRCSRLRCQRHGQMSVVVVDDIHTARSRIPASGAGFRERRSWPVDCETPVDRRPSSPSSVGVFFDNRHRPTQKLFAAQASAAAEHHIFSRTYFGAVTREEGAGCSPSRRRPLSAIRMGAAPTFSVLMLTRSRCSFDRDVRQSRLHIRVPTSSAHAAGGPPWRVRTAATIASVSGQPMPSRRTRRRRDRDATTSSSTTTSNWPRTVPGSHVVGTPVSALILAARLAACAP